MINIRQLQSVCCHHRANCMTADPAWIIASYIIKAKVASVHVWYIVALPPRLPTIEPWLHDGIDTCRLP